MANGPWSFDKHLVMLKDFNGALQPSEITFSTVEFWVHASNLPLISMTRDVGVLLGNNLGQFVDMEYGEGGIAWGRTLRIRVAINIAKPLRRGLKLSLGGRESVWVTLQYERLPNFCFHCGLLGHCVRDCGNRLLDGAPRVEVRMQYGPWLRADASQGRVRREFHGEPAESAESSQAISEGLPVHPGGTGAGSSPIFIPATADQHLPEGTSVEPFKSSKLPSDSLNLVIANKGADLVGSKNGMDCGELSLAPGSNFQISRVGAGLDQDVYGLAGFKDMEVVARVGSEDPDRVIMELGLGGKGGPMFCGTGGQSSSDLASLVRPILHGPSVAGPLKVGKKWKKLARGSSQMLDQQQLCVGGTRLTVGKWDRGLRDESSGSSTGSKKRNVKPHLIFIPSSSFLSSIHPNLLSSSPLLFSVKNSMGNTSSMLTQYDIEDVQEHCNHLFSQQEIVSLYRRFCQLDRNSKGFISADEFLSVPEFSMNPLSQRLIKMVDGLNFKDFVAFLSAFSAKASVPERVKLVFKVYDSDGNGKVTFNDILEVLQDLTGSFISDEQREEVLCQVLKEAGYTRDSTLLLADFIKILGKPGLKMEVEVPVD
ncbi:Calcineurin subunit B [Camellia lanceoleosa]|uniref:Calcineurin subunit B n=1 Tax=Camellia lanceoleosa TaxID=1840588 RepID=A0ACC0FCI9_9ERIC|nr:Calcineurin subunit B [Camellia lanceoleosa]